MWPGKTWGIDKKKRIFEPSALIQTRLSDSFSSLVIRVAPLIGQGWGWGSYGLILGRKAESGGEKQLFFSSAVSQLPSAQNNQYAQMAYLRMAFSDPLKVYVIDKRKEQK